MKNSLRHLLVLVGRQMAVVLVACLLLALAEPCSSAERVAVPSAAELKTAQAEIKELFKSELAAAKSGAQLTEVAERMLANFQDDANSRVNDYVLLTQAQATALKASNISLSLRVVSLLADRFEIDEPPLTLQTLKDLAKGPVDQTFHQQLANLALKNSADALRTDRLEIASQHLELVSSIATKLKSADLSKQASARRVDIAELRKLSEKFSAARKTLEKEATDASANDVVGRYVLLSQRDWKQALPLLAFSNDAALKSIAQSDWKAVNSDSSVSADEAVKLAGEWWELSLKQTVPG